MNKRSLVIPDCCCKGKKIPLSIEEVMPLRPIFGKTIKQIVDENPGILLFPEKLNEHEDGLGEDVLLSYDNKKELYFTSKTMGFVEFGGIQLKICSRFDSDGRDFFLMYMLNKVFKINIFNTQVSSGESNVLNLLMLMFPYALRRALKQGLYKEYFTNHYNDANIRGVVDVNRHIKQNIPFAGNVAYRTREQTYDNNMTQLIRHTIEFIESSPLKAICAQVKDEVSIIKRETPRYSKRARQAVIAKNLRPMVHPYYSEYKGLQHLCLQILRYKKTSFGTRSEKQLYGVLFDGAWLWEEYLNTILKKHGYIHPTNKNKVGGIRMFEMRTAEEEWTNNNRQMYPDFYSTKYKQVLDAKYKPKENIGRNDFYQVVTYMHTMKYDVGGFIYPFQKTGSGKKIDEFETYKLTGYGGYLCIIPFTVPVNCSNYEDFSFQMESSEKELINTLL